MKIFRYTDAKHRLAIEILLIFLLPILLFKWGIIPLSFRLFILSFVTLVVFAIVLREKWSLADLGFTKPTRKATLLYVSVTVIAALLMFLYQELLPHVVPETRHFYLYLLATFIPVSFFQEFLYRGFLMHMLQMVYEDKTTILIYNAILFTLLHIIYPFPSVALPLAFLGGLFFGELYLKKKNMYLVTVSHALLNFIALSLGFFVI